MIGALTEELFHSLLMRQFSVGLRLSDLCNKRHF